MQQADSAHSATGALASSGNTENHSATRRGMLTAFVALPAVALAGSGAAAVARRSSGAPNNASPVMAAIAAEIAVCERYGDLPHDLEFTHPALHAVEDQRLTEAWDRFVEAEPENWHDVIAQISHLTEDGEFGLLEEHTVLMLRRMRKLAA